MRFLKIISCAGLLWMALAVQAQSPSLQLLQSGKRVSLRGLSVVNDSLVWASGSGGTVARSADGGRSWTWLTVPGYEKRDFRGIEAFDDRTAVIMGIAEPAVILKTTDGGASWHKVFEDSTKGMFLDAMHFANEKTGIVIGDPINKKAFFARTYDGGNTWEKLNTASFPELAEGEAFFASSGTNVKLTSFNKEYTVTFISGGRKSNLWTGFYHKDSLPLMQGLESTGANSIAVNESANRAVVVGGDFAKDTISSGNCVLLSIQPGGVQVSKPYTPPHGYRSCVIYLNNQQLVTCGTSGVDISTDGGMNWLLIGKEGFHVVQKAKNGKAVYLAGGGGKIARLLIP